MNSLAHTKNPPISNQVLGMLVFILTEMMIFASFISAFIIIKSGALNWPPLGQPRLPVTTTAFNSFFLMVSAPLFIYAYRLFVQGASISRVKKMYLITAICGSVFFLLQGVEWIKLIQFGLTMSSGVYGSFFYLIVGAHALHVLVALVLLGVMYRRLILNKLHKNAFASTLALWLFVVGVWPVLYSLVYF
ncbi:cytochrome c oxidase subunit 3 [bacterium]|nr:cytochrome c oxidase subunit 3 [bacterium]